MIWENIEAVHLGGRGVGCIGAALDVGKPFGDPASLFAKALTQERFLGFCGKPNDIGNEFVVDQNIGFADSDDFEIAGRRLDVGELHGAIGSEVLGNEVRKKVDVGTCVWESDGLR